MRFAFLQSIASVAGAHDLSLWPSILAVSYGHSLRVASRAPSTSAPSLAHWIDGCTRLVNGPWAKPQSVPAMTWSRPTRLASRTMRWATSSGCSTMLVAWLITPGTRMRPSGSLTLSHTVHSCSWRGLAISIA